MAPFFPAIADSPIAQVTLNLAGPSRHLEFQYGDEFRHDISLKIPA
ncbi:hypothetical protein Slin14017_G122150 [Septoria linicola]|nr:hypothetical protein Slin14017_G122150 [Septoria linicola]